MVAAMSGLLRSARRSMVGLLVLTLVLGINGFVGAIHSAHHLPAAIASHEHDAQGQDDGERHTPAGAPDQGCPVAAAALHLAATTGEAPPVLGAFSPVALPLALGTPHGLRLAWREPAHGRAPPLLRSLPS
jgi:hypothetical protein